MDPQALPSLLPSADLAGQQACASKPRNQREEAGQFFTPPAIARSLAGWFDRNGLNRPSIHLLDPGAGGGALTAAFVDRIMKLRKEGYLPLLQHITLEVWELDETFIPGLRQNLSACAACLAQADIQAVVLLQHGDFIEGAVKALDAGLFGGFSEATITHVILNPPYRKIGIGSRHRKLLDSAGMETSNLYAAFVWLGMRQLQKGGELTAITPRSFCNGPYFRVFRHKILEESEFHRVHVFDSRAEAFGRDDVLQENILFHLRRAKRSNTSITISTGSLETPSEVRISLDRFVSPTDPDQIIHVATEADAEAVRGFVLSLPCGLRDLGMQVSTGPVVDFRLRDSLTSRHGLSDVPLIYPHCIKEGRVIAPLQRSTDYGDPRLKKKSVAIEINETTQKWLVPTARFVLIKRFSSKEEKRRLVAGMLNPADFTSELLGIENHLNFFHRHFAGLPSELANGLCRFLNSTVADRYFRQFNGHTQVNAADLRSFRYPDSVSLERLGRVKVNDADQASIDRCVTDCLGAPIFTGL